MDISDTRIFSKEKKLFKHTPSTKLSQVGWGKSEVRLMGYYMGYKNAADVLAEKVLQDNSSKSYDTLIYPIIFLYRHYLELVLKYIYIVFSSESTEEKIKCIKNVRHNIRRIWHEKVLQILKSENITDDDLNIACKYIEEFSMHDKTSFYFRYPFDTELNEVINKKQWIDIENFMEVMRELYNFFEVCINTLLTKKHIDNEFLSLEHDLNKMFDNEELAQEYATQQEYYQIMAEQHKDILKEYEKCFGIILE